MSSQVVSYLLSLFVSTGAFPVEPKQVTTPVIQPAIVQEFQVEQNTQEYQTEQDIQEFTPVVSTDTYEPNNTKNQAIKIENSIQSEISSETDIDYFEIEYKSYTIVQLTVNKSVEFKAEAENKKIYETISGDFKTITYASTKNSKIIIEIKGEAQKYSVGVTTRTAAVMNVNKIMQEQSQWCWAASSQIVASTMKNYGFGTTPITQTEIVSQIHKNTNNAPAQNINETANAVTYAIKDSGKRAKGFSGTLTKEEILKNIVVEKEPIVMRVGNGERNGHFVVITGVEIENNEVYLYIQDPLERNTIKTSLTDATKTGYKPGDNRVWNYTVEIV